MAAEHDRPAATALGDGSSPTSNSLTVLRCDSRHIAAKRFLADGTVLAYDAGSRFSHEVVPVTDIVSLAAALQTIEGDPRAFVIRGDLNPDIDPACLVYRRKRAKNGLPGFFRAEPRPWLMIDIDKLEAPEGISPTSVEAVEHAIRQLPSGFHDVSVFYQFSSSAGRQGQIIKVHLWFCFDRLVADRELKEWARVWNRQFGSPQLIDPALFDSIQVHYTAEPIFECGVDPVSARSGLIRRAHGVVVWEVPTPLPVSIPDPSEPTSEYVLGEDGRLLDGREGWFLRERFRILREEAPLSFQEFLDLSWHSFQANCLTGRKDDSSNQWPYERVVEKCRYDWEKFERGEFEWQRVPQDIRPAFELDLVDKDTGMARLRSEIASFFERPRNVAIRITSGAGKTHEACAAIAASHTPGRVVHYYVPTYRLAEEVGAKLQAMNPSLGVIIVRSRSENNCARFDVVQQFIDRGLPVQRTLCDGRSNKEPDRVCEHHSSCLYQAQFAPGHDVYIFTHQHLVRRLRPGIPEAHVNVIDESFLGVLTRTMTLDLAEISSSPVAEINGRPVLDEVIRRGLTSGAPLLQYLREYDVTEQLLKDEATAMQRRWFGPLFRAVDPRAAGDILFKIVRWVAKLPPRYHLYRQLAVEIGGVEPASRRVVLRNGKIVLRWRTRRALRPRTLVLDATANLEILKTVMRKVEFHAINIRRNAVVTQVVDRTMSKTSLVGDYAKETDQRLLQIALDRITSLYRTGVVATYKDLKKYLKVPSSWAIEHFGNMRGLDRYNRAEAVVLIGTYLLPIEAIEDVALPLFDKEPVMSAPGYGLELRGYCLKQGAAAARVRVHPDPLGQAILEQYREAEMIQGVDRIRIVHNDRAKNVCILSNLPLEIEVDHLITFQDLAGAEALSELLRRFGGVLPLHPGWLVQHAPDLFPAEEGAKTWARRVLGEFSNKYLLGNPPISAGSYRGEGKRGRHSSRFLYHVGHRSMRTALEALVGELAKYDGPEDLETTHYQRVEGLDYEAWQFVPSAPDSRGYQRLLLPPDLYHVLNPPLILART